MRNKNIYHRPTNNRRNINVTSTCASPQKQEIKRLQPTPEWDSATKQQLTPKRSKLQKDKEKESPEVQALTAAYKSLNTVANTAGESSRVEMLERKLEEIQKAQRAATKKSSMESKESLKFLQTFNDSTKQSQSNSTHAAIAEIGKENKKREVCQLTSCLCLVLQTMFAHQLIKSKKKKSEKEKV